MSFPIRLRITVEASGSWRIALGDRDTRAIEGVVDAKIVEEIRSSIEQLLRPAHAVLIRGRDAERSRNEEHAGRTLGQVLSAAPDLSERFAYHLGFARGKGETAVIVIDAEDVRVRALPWELLAAGSQSLEVSGEAVIARLAPGQPRRSPHEGRRLVPMIWSPTPDEPICAARIEATRALLGELGVEPSFIDPLRAPAPREPGTTPILHLIAHGDRIGDQILLSDAARSPDSASHALAPWARSAELAILDVCEAAGATPAELDSLAARLVASGTPSVIAPHARAGVDAARALTTGLYSALARGASLAEAIAEGRRAVRSLAIPHPDSRWSNFVLYAGDLETVARGGLMRPGWVPDSWPGPAADAARLLDRAFEIAKASSAGFVGLEHLAQAAETTEATGLTSRYVHFALASRREMWRSLSPGLVPSKEAADWRGTPRLRAYARALSNGFDLEALWQLICLDEDHALHDIPGVGSLLGAPGLMVGIETLPASGRMKTAAAVPATCGALQVLWGPEDGRVLAPVAGGEIGRWAGEAGTEATALYVRTFLTDPFISRAHLVWVGPGRILTKRPIDLVRGGATRPGLSGEIALEAGDILMLSQATRLRAVRGSGTSTPTP